MRKLFGVLALAAVAACAGEKPAPGTPAADSAPVAPATDSTGAQPADSTAPRGDSVMARDTAREM